MALDRFKTGKISGMTYECPSAGSIKISEPSTVVGVSKMSDVGVSFGPVELSAYPDSTITIADFKYEEKKTEIGSWLEGITEGDETDNSSAFGLMLAGFTANRADVEISRRDALKLVGVTAGVTGTASGIVSGETVVRIASFDLNENPSGLKFRIRDDVVKDLMPAGEIYYGTRDGIDYDKTENRGTNWAFLPPKLTGRIEIVSEVSFFARIKSLIGKKQITYKFVIPDDVTADKPITVTDNGIVANAVKKGGPDDTTLQFGDESIPHRTEVSSRQDGVYLVDNQKVVYRPGNELPTGQVMELTIYSGIVEEAKDDVSRAVTP